MEKGTCRNEVPGFEVFVGQPPQFVEFLPFIGSNEFPVDELLRNLGLSIELLPSSPSSATGCPVQVVSEIFPASGWSHGEGILSWDYEGFSGGHETTFLDI